MLRRHLLRPIQREVIDVFADHDPRDQSRRGIFPRDEQTQPSSPLAWNACTICARRFIEAPRSGADERLLVTQKRAAELRKPDHDLMAFLSVVIRFRLVIAGLWRSVGLHEANRAMNNWGQSLAPWKRASPGRAIVAGLVGSLVNTLAIRAAQMLPVPPGTGGFAKLVLAQTNQLLQRLGLAIRAPANFGPVGQEVFHTLIGVVMALVYAWFFYRWLRGPGWVRGLIFCQIPWLIQVLVVLPWMGSGAFGLKLSPLTPVISFLLNALYGVVLGATYRPKAR